jgi:hypothetical protein
LDQSAANAHSLLALVNPLAGGLPGWACVYRPAIPLQRRQDYWPNQSHLLLTRKQSCQSAMPRRALSATQVSALNKHGTHWVDRNLYLQIKPRGA